MGKMRLIIGREYWTRVKKKSFIIMTILGPILMAAVMIIPVYIAVKSEDKPAVIGIVDESGFYKGFFNDEGNIQFNYLSGSIQEEKIKLSTLELNYILYIPTTDSLYPTEAMIYGRENVGTVATSQIRSIMSNVVEMSKLQHANVDPALLKSFKTDIDIKSFKVDEEGNEKRSYTEVNQIIGYIGGFMIYMFIFMFGSQVMRGVMEEKSSRIVEVIVSSVKPFQLMVGKIVGVGLVGLTQFLLWIVLTFALVIVFGGSIVGTLSDNSVTQQITQTIPTNSDSLPITNIAIPDISPSITDVDQVGSSLSELINMISSINIPLILLSFLIYFIGGYLLYASMFAAVGGAVDSEDDTQQFIMPITIMLLLPILLIGNIINNPSGHVAIWLSMIPFTSPIAMMMRLPFTVPWWQLVISIAILFGSFIFMTWLSGKIYRTGILMYGKKVTWREIWKWIRV